VPIAIFRDRWDGLKQFNGSPRKPIYCKGGEAVGTQGFVRSYKNLKFYWILGAGHMVIHHNLAVTHQIMKHIMILFGNSGEPALNMPHHRSTPAIGIAV
jgi:hypothetical protein